MKAKLTAVRVNARQQVATTGRRIRRISAGSALVRLAATVAAGAALTAALPLGMMRAAPPSVPLRVFGAVIVVSCAVGLFPRTRWVTLVALAAIGVWVFGTVGLGQPVGVFQVGVLAGSLYLMHAAAAFAAALPYDCVIAPRVLLGWLGRVASVLGLSLLLGLVGMGLAGKLPSVHSVVGPIVGSVVAAGLAGLLAWQLRRGRG